jgi:hypothetical protein
LFQACISHHLLDLTARESLFEARAEPIECIGSHRVEAAVMIGAKRDR